MATSLLSPNKGSKASPSIPPGMDPAYYALSLLRRRKLDQCVVVSAAFLQVPQGASPSSSSSPPLPAGPPMAPRHAASLDETIWYVQTRALLLQSWFDDVEIEDDGVDDVLMEGEQAVVSTAHRANTSLRTARRTTAGGMAIPGSRAGKGGSSYGGRPVSSRYGFARPGSQQNRPGSVRNGPGGTAVRPVTGRFVRIGTASLQAVPGGPHIDVQRLNLEKYAREKPMIAKLLCDYLLYVEHKPKLALELCTAALKVGKAPVGGGGGVGPGLPPMLPMGPGVPPPAPAAVVKQVGIPAADDWWWKARLAKANYQLGLLREAEKYLKLALFEAPVSGVGARGGLGGGQYSGGKRFVNYNTSVIMELGKVYTKMDQPLTALELYESALAANPVDHHVVLCCARLRDELHEPGTAYDLYNQVLHLDSSNVESLACIGAHLFYEKNQPELALRYYRRLLQMGLQTAEIWVNIGLCAFYTFQNDLALSSLVKALVLCKEDTQRADVWYNIGHVGVSMGHLKFAEHAFRLAVAADPTHAEALNNLAVLAHQRKQEKTCKRLLDTAVMAAPELPEALYNAAMVAFQAGELEVAQTLVMQALDVLPDHAECVALRTKLREIFIAL